MFVLACALNFGIRALNEQVKKPELAPAAHTRLSAPWSSGTFLFLIAVINVVILAGIVKVFRGMRRGHYDDEALDEQLNTRGLMNRFLGPLARRIDTPWKMYPIGFLFGLGFDTATEVALLVLAGTAVIGRARRSTPCCPCRSRFAAGMSLLDTADGCFMNFAYDWAFAWPVRKVYYNPDHHRAACSWPCSSVRGGAGPAARTAPTGPGGPAGGLQPQPGGLRDRWCSSCTRWASPSGVRPDRAEADRGGPPASRVRLQMA